MFKIDVSAHTDIGDIKQTNQDCIFARNETVNNRDAGLFIVADGCGGMAYGEEISKLAVTYFSRVWSNDLKALLEEKKIKHSRVDEILENAIKEINQGALLFSRQVNSKVGSTLSLLLTIDNTYYIKNIGDSRVYRIRGKKMQQLTEDQSLVAELLRNGEITAEEARNFNRKNVLTMCIGVFDELHTFTTRGKIRSGDSFLICCDGLHNHMEEDAAIGVIKGKSDFESRAQQLRELIPAGCANDNVSSVICRFKKKIKLLPIIIAAVICLLVATGFVFKNNITDFCRELMMDNMGGLCEKCGELPHPGSDCVVVEQAPAEAPPAEAPAEKPAEAQPEEATADEAHEEASAEEKKPSKFWQIMQILLS